MINEKEVFEVDFDSIEALDELTVPGGSGFGCNCAAQ